jgi:hypothetical protein
MRLVQGELRIAQGEVVEGFYGSWSRQHTRTPDVDQSLRGVSRP